MIGASEQTPPEARSPKVTVMRTLVVMRHAKTEPTHLRGDHARRLTQRGRDEAEQVGRELAGLGIDLVLCSSAVRTRETVTHLGLDASVEHLDALYHAGPDEMVEQLSEVDPAVSSVLVVAHNPSVAWLSSLLAQPHSPEQADEIASWFPTSAWAQFSYDGDWDELANSFDRVRLVGVHRVSETR